MDEEQGKKLMEEVLSLLEDRIGPNPLDAYSFVVNLSGNYMAVLMKGIPMKEVEHHCDEFCEQVKTVCRSSVIAWELIQAPKEGERC